MGKINRLAINHPPGKKMNATELWHSLSLETLFPPPPSLSRGGAFPDGEGQAHGVSPPPRIKVMASRFWHVEFSLVNIDAELCLDQLIHYYLKAAWFTHFTLHDQIDSSSTKIWTIVLAFY